VARRGRPLYRNQGLRYDCLVLFKLLACLSISGAAWAQVEPSFDVASIKPAAPMTGGPLAGLREDINASKGSLNMRNAALGTCIRWAYKLNVYEIDGPDFMTRERFDIVAKPVAAAEEDQLRLMLRTLLAQRFKLEAHRESKTASGYALMAGSDSSKLHPAEGGGEGSMTGAGLIFEGHKMPLSRLVDIVSSALKAPVRNATGLEGFYDFKLDMRPYVAGRQPDDPPIDFVSIAMSALRDELGLKLEARKVQLDVLVVDRLEKVPLEN